VGNLAIIGGLGAAALTFGIVLHQSSKSSMQITEVEDTPWLLQLEPVVNAQGVGVSF
jgi:hypothetical protein